MREDQRGQGQGRRDRRGSGERRTGTRAAGGSAAQAAQTAQDDDAERRRRRAVFLRELNEAKALRERVQPRRARAARMRQAMRMRTFRW
ncbi:hypothetical protein ACLIYM_23730 [Streptomyces fenghuangensis]|uniref:hypothetical protein n=1 Tax=Streptomyces sp. ICN903 TaxID=2964654 RepID=UPI001EDA1615|nr:hypothetical protein [Streptomyces sp. ICN903]MCG3039834.1 hypothetical protein [Streptomyces sp. ICN903]